MDSSVPEIQTSVQGLVKRNSGTEKFTMELDVTRVHKGSSPATTYLLSLFNFLRWSWVIPYRIQRSRSGSAYKICTNSLKKVIIWILLFGVTLYNAVLFVFHMKSDSSIKGVVLHTITFSLTCWSSATLIILWRNRNKFAEIMGRLDDISFEMDRRSQGPKPGQVKARNLGLNLVLSICIIMSFLEAYYDHLLLNKENRFMKPFEAVCEQNDNVRALFPKIQTMPGGGYLLCFLGLLHTMFPNLYYSTIGHFGYITLLVFCIIICKLFRGLNATMPKGCASKEEIISAIGLYNELCSFTATVNKAIGTMMVWSVMAHLPYNAHKVNDLVTGSPFAQGLYIVHVSVYISILYVGATVQSQINIFTDKLACDTMTLQDDSLESKVSLLLQQSKLVGMRGGGFFRLTYGFLANIIGVVLTYAVVLVQFHYKDCTNTRRLPTAAPAV